MSASSNLPAVSRGSRLKHVYCTGDKAGHCFTNAQPVAGAGDAPPFAASATHFAFAAAGGGGPVIAHPLSSPGKLAATPPALTGHAGAATALAFDAHEDAVLYSGGDDCTVAAWRLPAEGPVAASDSPAIRLSGHERTVRVLAPHPAAAGLLASADAGGAVHLWDTAAAARVSPSGGLPIGAAAAGDGLGAAEWSADGRLLAAAGRGGAVALVDARAAGDAAPVAELTVDGGRALKLQWLSPGASAGGLLLTTALTRRGERQVAVWDARKPDAPVSRAVLDRAAGQLLPLADPDTGLLVLAARGEAGFRTFDTAALVSGSSTELEPCARWQPIGAEPICALAALPKRVCDVMNVEVLRVLRLCPESVRPLHVHVPRSDGLRAFFQDDLFPPARAGHAAVSAAEWLDGSGDAPATIDLCPAGVTRLSARRTDEVAETTSRGDRMRAEMQARKEAEAAAEAKVLAFRAQAVAAASEKDRLPCEGTSDQSEISDWSDDE